MTGSRLRRLIACPECHLQFDATGHDPPARFHCACGALIALVEIEAHEAAVVRCSACGAPRSKGAPACTACGADFTLHEQDLDTLCPHCMTRIDNRSRHCHSCGSRIVPQGTIGELTERPCPSCGDEHPLYSRNVEGEVTVLECDRCAGIWVGHELFRLLEERVDRNYTAWAQGPPVHDPTAPQAGERFYRPCIACGKPMHRRNYGHKSGVIVDVCREHGLWFDLGELDRILEWRREGGEHRVPAQPRPARPVPSVAPATPFGELGFFDLLIDLLVDFFADR